METSKLRSQTAAILAPPTNQHLKVPQQWLGMGRNYF